MAYRIPEPQRSRIVKALDAGRRVSFGGARMKTLSDLAQYEATVEPAEDRRSLWLAPKTASAPGTLSWPEMLSLAKAEGLTPATAGRPLNKEVVTAFLIERGLLPVSDTPAEREEDAPPTPEAEAPESSEASLDAWAENYNGGEG